MSLPTSLSVLVLSTEFPLPANSGGRARTLAQLELLAGLPLVSKMRVQTLHEGDGTELQLRALQRRLPQAAVSTPVFHPIHLRTHLTAVPRMLWARSKGTPYLAAKWQSAAIEAALEGHAQHPAPDVVYIDHLGLAQYLPRIRELFPSSAVVLEQHNVESDFFKQFAAECRPALRPVAAYEAQVARAFERATLQAVDAVVAISEDDARAFGDMAGVRATVVPLRVDVPASRAAFAPAPDELLYVGNLGWRPNARGLDWFFEQVWPKARALNPRLRLTVVGSGLPLGTDGKTAVPSAWQQPGVRVLGYVEDLAPHYDRASALVAPVVGGSGVRIKLLHAMAAGVPVVTTADGAAGLALTSGKELDISRTPQQMAEHMVALASDPELGVGRRHSADAYLAKQHSRAACEAAMSEVLLSALQRRDRRRFDSRAGA